MSVEIVMSPAAFEHLTELRIRDRRIVIDAIETFLTHTPDFSTRRVKPLRPNPLASWELRVGRYRVYYQVETEQDVQVVTVLTVGRKIRDRVIIGRVEVNL